MQQQNAKSKSKSSSQFHNNQQFDHSFPDVSSLKLLYRLGYMMDARDG